MSQTQRESTPGQPPGTPRWVKVFGIIAIALVLLFVILQIASGGEHGPRRHSPAGDAGGQAVAASVTADHASFGAGRGARTTPIGLREDGVQ